MDWNVNESGRSKWRHETVFPGGRYVVEPAGKTSSRAPSSQDRWAQVYPYDDPHAGKWWAVDYYLGGRCDGATGHLDRDVALAKAAAWCEEGQP
jgi:hypothetical protein